MPNYLSDMIGSGADYVKKRAKNVLGELANAPQSLAQMLDPKWQAEMRKPDNMAKFSQQADEIGNSIGPSVMGIGATAYHGSPHLFDKFKTSAIGTGEGAQAYGHGLYLAEHPDVAREYAQTLDPMVNAARSGVDAEGTAARVLQGVDFNKQRAIEELTRRKNAPHVQGDSEWAAKMDAAIAHIKGVDKTSNFYKTDIPDAHINKMLDWDKPLSEQSQHVRDAIKTNMDLQGVQSYKTPDGENVYLNIGSESGLRGQDLYRLLGKGQKSEDAASLLHSLGIPGIKYLDRSSRAAGNGTRNFVMFNPEDIRILERNKIPTGQKPWDAK